MSFAASLARPLGARASARRARAPRPSSLPPSRRTHPRRRSRARAHRDQGAVPATRPGRGAQTRPSGIGPRRERAALGYQGHPGGATQQGRLPGRGEGGRRGRGSRAQERQARGWGCARHPRLRGDRAREPRRGDVLRGRARDRAAVSDWMVRHRAPHGDVRRGREGERPSSSLVRSSPLTSRALSHSPQSRRLLRIADLRHPVPFPIRPIAEYQDEQRRVRRGERCDRGGSRRPGASVHRQRRGRRCPLRLSPWWPTGSCWWAGGRGSPGEARGAPGRAGIRRGTRWSL